MAGFSLDFLGILYDSNYNIRLLLSVNWVTAVFPLVPKNILKIQHIAQIYQYIECQKYCCSILRGTYLACAFRDLCQELVYKVEMEPLKANCGQNADLSRMEASKLES